MGNGKRTGWGEVLFGVSRGATGPEVKRDRSHETAVYYPPKFIYIYNKYFNLRSGYYLSRLMAKKDIAWV